MSTQNSSLSRRTQESGWRGGQREVTVQHKLSRQNLYKKTPQKTQTQWYVMWRMCTCVNNDLVPSSYSEVCIFCLRVLAKMFDNEGTFFSSNCLQGRMAHFTWRRHAYLALFTLDKIKTHNIVSHLTYHTCRLQHLYELDNWITFIPEALTPFLSVLGLY